MKRILTHLQVSEEQQEIERCTVGQFDSGVYIAYKNRVSASHFGLIVKRLDHTSCLCIVKTILYGNMMYSAAMVRLRFSEENKLIVWESGQFIDMIKDYLGATPDGLIGNNALLEIKCLYKISQEHCSLKEGVVKYKNLCSRINSFGELELKKNQLLLSDSRPTKHK